MDRKFKRQLREAAENAFLVLGRTPHDSIRWLTIILSAYVVSIDSNIWEQLKADVDQFGEDLRTAMMKSGRIRRGTRWTGVPEIDLLHPRWPGGERKLALLEQFGIDTDRLRPDQRVVILHWHGVVDHRGHSSAALMMDDLRDMWPGPWRIVGKTLHERNSVAQNLSNLADYSTKFRWRYAEAWEGKPTKFFTDFEPQWREFCQRAYVELGVRRCLVGNIVSRSEGALECTHAEPKSPVSVEENNKSDPMQLSIKSNGKEKGYNDHETYNNCHAKDEEDMKIEDVIPYFNLEVIKDDLLKAIIDDLSRRDNIYSDTHTLQAQYGCEMDELDLQHMKLLLRRTEAETARALAAALSDLATEPAAVIAQPLNLRADHGHRRDRRLGDS